jgi:hypothetical protein
MVVEQPAAKAGFRDLVEAGHGGLGDRFLEPAVVGVQCESAIEAAADDGGGDRLGVQQGAIFRCR